MGLPARVVRASPAQLQAEQATLAAVQAARDAGVVGATRLDALSYVAYRAMSNVQKLSELEAMYSRMSPLGEQRYAAIVDSYAAVAAQTILGAAGRGY